MVDVTAKDATYRRAIARCRVQMLPETAAKIAAGAITKGDVLAVARVAGIQAAKQTSNLVPLCHPLLVDRTGVEMEALTACSVAALTIYDMCKSIDRGMAITDLALWEKTGGRSGTYHRDPDAPAEDFDR